MKTRLARFLRNLGIFIIMLYAIPPSQRYDGPRWSAGNRLAMQLPQPAGRGPLPAQGADLLITKARLLDGTGAPPRAPVSILVRRGVITRIADPVAMAAELATSAGQDLRLSELDVGGRTVMPGLIDAHVHIGMTPAAAARMDSAETTVRLLHHHLKAYLANGVTTILDPAVNPEVAISVQR